jgi:hypothetical protein
MPTTKGKNERVKIKKSPRNSRHKTSYKKTSYKKHKKASRSVPLSRSKIKKTPGFKKCVSRRRRSNKKLKTIRSCKKKNTITTIYYSQHNTYISTRKKKSRYKKNT